VNETYTSPLEAPNYGRIARVYRWLEYAAFGGALQRSRETFIDRLHSARSIAVFGGGDGRCFEAILRECPEAKVDAFDIDPVMIAFARRRADAVAPGRVSFHQADARTRVLPAGHYDAVVTQYFLDCFPSDQLQRLIPSIENSLKSGALWLFADFAIPPPGAPAILRWRAQITIAILCWFFRWQVKHPLHNLPPMEEMLLAQGWAPLATRERSGRMVRTVLFQKTAT